MGAPDASRKRTPKRLRQTGAAVVGRRAAEPDDDLLDAAVDGIGDQLAGAEGGCGERIALALGTSGRPEASAISMTAVRPPPSRP